MDTAPPSATSSTDRRTDAWTRLQTGNAHWVAGTTGDHSGRSPQRRADLVAGQTPFAAVLSCATRGSPRNSSSTRARATSSSSAPPATPSTTRSWDRWSTR